jgi:hypothetical protein
MAKMSSGVPIEDLTDEEVAQLSTGVLLDLLVRERPTSDLHAMARNELARRIDGDEVT